MSSFVINTTYFSDSPIISTGTFIVNWWSKINLWIENVGFHVYFNLVPFYEKASRACLCRHLIFNSGRQKWEGMFEKSINPIQHFGIWENWSPLQFQPVHMPSLSHFWYFSRGFDWKLVSVEAGNGLATNRLRSVALINSALVLPSNMSGCTTLGFCWIHNLWCRDYMRFLCHPLLQSLCCHSKSLMCKGYLFGP